MRATHAGPGAPCAAARAEAAAWIARLHGPSRTREVDEGLRRWLAQDPEHAVAFELLTDVWEKAAHLKRRPMDPAASPPRAAARASFMRAALAMILMAFLAARTLRHPHSDVLATRIGQLRIVTLADGTRIHLDADSKLLVRYGQSGRHVVLLRGQAYFDVAHRPDRPFLVTAAGHTIRDVGTQFAVRREGGVLAVMLAQGRVTVSGVRVFDLAPGERLTFSAAGSPRIDWPSVKTVTAWEHGQVPLEDTTLADAAAELNRYSRRRIVVDPAVAAIRVSGIVQAGASSSFAAAVARTYGLRVVRPSADLIVLAPGR